MGSSKTIVFREDIDERYYVRKNVGMIAFVPCIGPYGLMFKSISFKATRNSKIKWVSDERASASE